MGSFLGNAVKGLFFVALVALPLAAIGALVSMTFTQPLVTCTDKITHGIVYIPRGWGYTVYLQTLDGDYVPFNGRLTFSQGQAISRSFTIRSVGAADQCYKDGNGDRCNLGPLTGMVHSGKPYNVEVVFSTFPLHGCKIYICGIQSLLDRIESW